VVLSATIDRYAYATLTKLSEQAAKDPSRNTGQIVHNPLGESISYNGRFDLFRACLERLMPETSDDWTGMELFLESNVPSGSGLGGSSSIVVAAIGALRKWLHLPLDNYQMAHLAWEIERLDMGDPGGMQDQYSAVFGGINLIEFNTPENVIVTPLRIDRKIVYELQYNLLLVFTGSRKAGHIIEELKSGYSGGNADVLDALDRIKALTYEAKNALLTGRLGDLAAILHESWLEKKRTATSISTSFIDEIYEEARRLGALGGKVSGAGGGGYLFLYCPFNRKRDIAQRLQQMGCSVSSVAFDFQGLRSWTW
jgi:D-glycero-alpha-D-manno-heptose-7-phosphate kinase